VDFLKAQLDKNGPLLKYNSYNSYIKKIEYIYIQYDFRIHDNTMDDTDGEFQLIVEIIKSQNIMLLTRIAEKYNIDHNEILSKFLKPNYYIPYIENIHKKRNKKQQKK